jgi:hypothetical protein
VAGAGDSVDLMAGTHPTTVRSVKRSTATSAVLGCLLTLAACGGADSTGTAGKSSDSNATDQQQIRDVFAAYSSAMKARRFQDVCSLNTPEFNEELIAEVKGSFDDRRPVTCERALRVVAASAGDEAPPLKSIVVSGVTATGRVGAGQTTWRFARVGGAWKVAYAN